MCYVNKMYVDTINSVKLKPAICIWGDYVNYTNSVNNCTMCILVNR